MSRETLVPLALVVFALVAIGSAYAWYDAQREAETTREHEARIVARHDEQRTESRELLAAVIGGVELGMSVEQVMAARPRDAVEHSSAGVDPGLTLYEEHLANGGQVMYAFDDDELVRVQALSQLESVDAIPSHLAGLGNRFGAPTGIWDCRDTGGIATRRFTWRRSHVGLADILLVVGGRVSVTLYVTTNEQMGASLQRASCAPVSRDRIDTLPTSDPSDVRRAAEETESGP